MINNMVVKTIYIPEELAEAVDVIKDALDFKTYKETYIYILSFGIHNIASMLAQGDEYDVADYPVDDDDDYDCLEDGTRIVC